MKLKGLMVIVVALTALGSASPALGQGVPSMISYQGKLADAAGDPITAIDVPMVFFIYDQDVSSTPMFEGVILGGTTPAAFMYQNLLPNSESVSAGATVFVRDVDYVMNYPDGTIARTPGSSIPSGWWVWVNYSYQSGGLLLWSQSRNVDVVGGIFSVSLGDGDTFPEGMFAMDDSTFLEVSVYGEKMSPRARFMSVPYALTAERLGGSLPSEFAQSYHEHVFGSITGAATDAQVPNNITITMSQDSQLLDGLDGAAYVHVAGDTVTGSLQVNGGLNPTTDLTIGRDVRISGGNLGLGRLPSSDYSIINDQATAPNLGAKFYGSYYGLDARNTANTTYDYVQLAGTDRGVNVSVGDSTGGDYVYGIRLDARGTGTVFGTYSTAFSYGTGTFDYAYGGYFIADDVGKGVHIGVHGVARGSSNSAASRIGISGWADTEHPDGTAVGGEFNTGDTTSLGTRYGVKAMAMNNDDNNVYGVYSTAISYNPLSSAYGGFFMVPNTSTASLNAAIYAASMAPGAYAGLFEYGLVQVGTPSSYTPTKAEGSGDLFVADELEVKGDVYYTTNKTRYLNVPFFGNHDTNFGEWAYQGNQIECCCTTNCGVYYPVVLPERATITNVRITGLNQTSSQIWFYLKRTDMAGTNSQLASLNFSTPGNFNQSTSAITYPEVDNTYRYQIHIIADAYALPCRVYGVTITYTVDGPE